MKNNSYDTCLKHLVRLRLTDSIPTELLKRIPKSNIYRWRSENKAKYVGCELNEISKQQYKLLKKTAKSHRAQQIIHSYFQLIKVCQSAIQLSRNIQFAFQESKEAIVDCVQRVRHSIGVKKSAHFLGISVSTFYNWLLETKSNCTQNYFSKCIRLRPNQLTRKEVIQIRKLLLSPKLQYWPVSSIAYYAKRHNLVNISLSTFYKYSKLLGLSRPHYKKPRPRTGIRASMPNSYWHADITIFKIQNRKYYIYLLMDNFSRLVLNWKISEAVSGKTMRTLLAEAIALYKPQGTKLIVDGGSENHNHQVNQLMTENSCAIEKITAQVDITYSNSLVEAQNKIVKNSYLKMMDITSLKQLEEKLEFTIEDYNHVRPHISLKGLTPYEVFHQKSIESIINPIEAQQTVIKRIAKSIEQMSKVQVKRFLKE